MTLAWHTTTGSPLLRYDRNITAPFLEDDSLFILEHFPLPSTLTISSIPASELQQSLSLELHSRHRSLASLGSESVGAQPMAIPMGVGVGTPIKVAIDSDVRVRKVGQAIQCRTT